jgi:hypothetical protein
MIHQYPIIRPAVIAVAREMRDIPPITANFDCSRAESSRILRCFGYISRDRVL